MNEKKLCYRRVVSFSLNYIFTKFEKNSLKNGGLVGNENFQKVKK